MTCSSRSAWAASSRVARKEATRWWGSRRMNPTVSVSRIFRLPSRSTERVRRVQGGEELVLDEHVGAGQGPHQRRLAGVGVADQGHPKLLPPPLAAGLELAVDAVELAGQRPYAAAGSCGGRSRAAFRRDRAHPAAPHAADGASAGLSREVGPMPGQAGQQVVELGELDLDLRGPRARVLGEDVEDDGAAVEDAKVGEFFEVAHLRRGEIAVEDDHPGPGRRGPGLELFRLALPYVIAGLDARARLGDKAGHLDRRRGYQARELVERILGFPARRVGEREADEEGGLGRMSGGFLRLSECRFQGFSFEGSAEL